MTIWLINGKETETKGRRPVARKKKATKKRPSRKQLAARRKFAAMARARAKAARASKAGKRSATMAKKRRATTKRRPRRRTLKSVRRKGGGSVSASAWRASGFRRNPRRGRRRYRRNPGFSAKGILGSAVDLSIGAVSALAGAALGNRLAAYIPLNDTDPSRPPVMAWGKSVLLAVLTKHFGKRIRVLPSHVVDSAALGMVLFPTKNLVTALAPSAAPFLGSVTALPSFPGGARRLSSYSLNGMGDYADPSGDEAFDTGLGAYTGGF